MKALSWKALIYYKQKTLLSALPWVFIVFVSFVFWSFSANAQDETVKAAEATNNAALVDNTLRTLKSFLKLSRDQQADIDAQKRLLKSESSEVEKARVGEALEKLREEQRTTEQNFKEIAAGTDISVLEVVEEKKFNLQEEVLALLKPAFDEVREMTAGVRQKTTLKEEIVYYQERLPVIETVIANVNQIKAANDDESLQKALDESLDEWLKQQVFMQSQLQASQVQLDKLLASESSISESSQAYFKTFFKKRGLYIFLALLSVAVVLLISKISYSAMKKTLPGFHTKHRSFRTRLLELIHRGATLFFVVIGPMLVFFIVEDWVLFSLGILLLIGLVWTLVRALPLIWRQVHLFLNIGSVREGERIDYDGLPWIVQRINLYCDLTNPVADMSLRVPIADMVELKSRPFASNEPWFPCKQGDWVILSDGARGIVTGISPELVQIVRRGGSQLTYSTADFIAQMPHNLATNFRIKEILGISYVHQKESTDEIPKILHKYITERAIKEDYGDQLLNLRVELAQANSSSLDIVVIADFKGELGGLYNRLRRAIQRWSVDACTENGWEIPFPQMTLHGAVDIAR